MRGVREYTQKLLRNLDDLDPDIEVIKVNAPLDHIHMVVVIPPRVAVADVIQFLKSQSGTMLKAKFPFLQKLYWSRGGIWSRGYCVSSVGLNEKEILAYVTYQDKRTEGNCNSGSKRRVKKLPTPSGELHWGSY